MNDEYLSIKSRVDSKIKIKGSVFIGTAMPVSSEAAADTVLNSIRKKYNDATHNCFAYRIGSGPGILERSSDDGEPSGTAGRPILQVVAGRGISDILFVVTRYFGGVKLGKGGLIRAYSESTRNTLDIVKPLKVIQYDRIEIVYNFALINLVQRSAGRFNAVLEDTVYDESEITSCMKIRQSQKTGIIDFLINESSGKIKISGEKSDEKQS